MKRYAVLFALTCGWTSPGLAADPPDVGQSPDDNIRICDSEFCINAAWDYFTWCWFGSGLPRNYRMQAADEWHYAEYGHYYYSEWEYDNEPNGPDAKRLEQISRSFRDFGGLVPSTSGSDHWDREVAYTADLGNGLKVSIPMTESSQPRYTPEYVKICSLEGAGFYYVPGTDMCIKIGGFIRQGGQSYETVKPKSPAPKLSYTYDSEWSIGASVNYNISDSLKLGVDYGGPGNNASSSTDPAPVSNRGYSGGGGGSTVVEYVRICTLYGNGFYYVPGTDTCLKISGNVAYQEQSPLRNRISTRLGGDGLDIKINIQESAQVPAETANTSPRDDSVKTPSTEILDSKKLPLTEAKGAKGPSAKKTVKGEPKQAKPAPAQAQVKPELSTTPRWVDAKTGQPVEVGPEGTRTGLFDANEAFDPESGKSYRRENGIWKNEKTGEVVVTLPIHAKPNKDDPNAATHLYSGRQFRFEGGNPAAPKQADPGAPAKQADASAPQTPRNDNGQWVDAKTGEPVQVGPDGARTGWFDPNEAFNPGTGKSYKKENGVWKDRATGKEVPEIPINSQQDPADPNKAKHAFNDRTFVNVSPKVQAEQKVDGLKAKLEEAKAKLKTAEATNDKDTITIQRGRIAELEAGKDPEEESAKAKARGEKAKQVIHDLEDFQVPAALSEHQARKEVYEKETHVLDSTPKDGPRADPKKRAEQERTVKLADRRMFDAAMRYWRLKTQLQDAKTQYDKYGELRPETPEEREKRIKEFSDAGLKAQDAEQKAIESQFGKVPDQVNKPVTGQKSASSNTTKPATKGPQKAAKDGPATQKQAEKPSEPPTISDGNNITINITGSSWNYDQPSFGQHEPFLVNFVGYTAPLELDQKNDTGFDEPAALAAVINGRGSYKIDFNKRQQFGLNFAKPGANFLLGMNMPKLSEFVMQVAADKAGIPTKIPAGDLPSGTSLFMETVNVDGTRYVRVGAQERFDMAQQWLTGLALAKMFNMDPAALFDDWCWQKLPAYELDPPSSTARGEGLPHATLKLSDARRSLRP